MAYVAPIMDASPQPLILIAEDDKALSTVHRILLEDQGHRIKIVETGDQAIEAIDKEQPALLLLDLLMPAKDGFAVLRHIVEKGYKFPVVVLTNLSSEHDKHECLALGAKECLVKSETESEQIQDIIKRYVG